MFTFRCPACRKQHLVSGPFPGGYQTRCLRCDELIRVTRKMVRVGKDGSVPFGAVPPVPARPVEPPAKPTPPPAKPTPAQPVAVHVAPVEPPAKPTPPPIRSITPPVKPAPPAASPPPAVAPPTPARPPVQARSAPAATEPREPTAPTRPGAHARPEPAASHHVAAAPPVEPPTPPAADPPPAVAPPAAPARPPAHAGSVPPATESREPATPSEPVAGARSRWRQWAYAGAAGALFAAGVGVYLVAGVGKTGPTTRARSPVAGGPVPISTGKAAPGQQTAPKREPERPKPAARDVVAAALAADPARFRHVRLADAALHDRVLTLEGAVRSPALKAEVEWVAVEAVRKAGLGTDVRVENRLREPLDLVREAVARKFGKEVTVTGVRLEDDRLSLHGRLTRWGDLQPVRELAVRALEEAGLGPITTWDNHLKKPMN